MHSVNGRMPPSCAAAVHFSRKEIRAVDTGVLRLIVRTGVTLEGKVITKLSFLPVAAGVSGQTRNFNQSTGDLLYKATFADGSTGICKVIFP